MVFGMDMLHAVGTIPLCLIVVFRGFTVHAEGASSTQIQVIGYLSERSIISCPHKVPREALTDVTWYKGNGIDMLTVAKLVALPGGDGRFRQLIQHAELEGRAHVTYNTLEILAATLSDGGHYSCSTSDQGRAQPIWWTSNLIIYVRPENIAMSPRLDEGLREGTHIDVTCTVQQVKPRPKIFWRIGDVEPLHNSSHLDKLKEYQNGTFSIQSSYQLEARRQDHGKFLYCIVTLDDDRQEVLGSERTRVSVHYKPYGLAEISPLMLEMAEGSTDTLFCTPPSVPGNPTPTWFVWRMQNDTFLENTTSPELKLSPQYVNESHLYQCMAGNYLGESGASEWANVTVLDASIILSRDRPLVRSSGIVPLVVGVVLTIVLVICIVVVVLIVWRHKRKSDGTYSSGGTKSAILSMESMPLQYRPNVSDVIRNHPDATPSPPKKPPRIYSYEHSDVYKKYFEELPTPPPSPPAPLEECDDNKNVYGTTQDEDKAPKEEIVYAELKHACPGQKDITPPQPKQRVVYADLRFNTPITGN